MADAHDDVGDPARSMRARIAFLATILATMIPAAAMRAEAVEDGDRQARLFPRPVELDPAIAFWRRVFAEYSVHQVVLHDALHLDKVYKVLDFRSEDDDLSGGQLARLERIDVDLETERLRATLLRLHGLGPHPEDLTTEERRIYDLYKDDPS